MANRVTFLGNNATKIHARNETSKLFEVEPLMTHDEAAILIGRNSPGSTKND